MNTIAIIGRGVHPRGKETALQLTESLGPFFEQSKYKVLYIDFDNIIFDIQPQHIKVIDTKSGMHLHECAAVMMMNWFGCDANYGDIAHAIALYLDMHKVPVTNSEALYNRSRSKLSQMMLAALHDIPIARTLFCVDLAALRKYMDMQAFGVPFIFKKTSASRGQDNYLLTSIEEIMRYDNEDHRENPFLVQQFIVSDGSDYRLFMVGGDIKLVIRRIGEGDSHLHNTSMGASTEIIPVNSLSRDIIHIAKTMSSVLHRELTGLDVIVDSNSGRPYFLEANLIPQIATGSNVSRKLEVLAEGLCQVAGG